MIITTNAFPYKFLIEASLNNGEFVYPNFLREIIKKRDVSDVGKLGEFFSIELQNSSVQNQSSAEYFQFIAHNALMYAFLNKDIEGFVYCVEIIKHRMVAVRNITAIDVNLEAWEQFLDLINAAFYRLIKYKPIEAFEENISNLDWSIFDKSFIGKVSSLIGIVYAEEERADQNSKSRIWLQKAINETDFQQNLVNYLFLLKHFLGENSIDNTKRIHQILDQIKDGAEDIEDSSVAYLFKNAVREIEALIDAHHIETFNDDEVRENHYQAKAENLNKLLSEEVEMPGFTRWGLETGLARLYQYLYTIVDDEVVQEKLRERAIEHSEKALQIAENRNDDHLVLKSKHNWLTTAIRTGKSIAEKEVKDVSQAYKKTKVYPAYIEAMSTYLEFLAESEQGYKSEDLLADILKYGSKRLEEGGFYVITRGLGLANEVFERERQEPGVSWMVKSLDSFFEQIMGVVDSIDEFREWTSNSQIEDFRNNFIDFEPYSHFNIKTYYTYQYYQLKLLRIGALINNDPISLKISESMITAFEDENNPMSFIKANWDEFKDVPNSVRNKTLNKCINISKGDLPLAAEHLDFSYRNLRSYITFKEVNRLGFFLNIQETNNRQLEQGIRLMFFDLYKKGTIFEVVFDMPKFLVDFADRGFFSQDLEQNLNIKGTTAKKYIKIMIQNNMIKQDKTLQRKHYYRLLKDNAMKRLGSDQATLIR
jgi:hypothetical protein